MISKHHRNITKTVEPDATYPTGDGRYDVTVSIDVYDILTAWDVTNPATQHAIKKLLMLGQRGAKTAVQDLQEARDSINRAIELESGK